MIIIFMVYHESANFVFSCPAGAWWETGGGGHKIRHVGPSMCGPGHTGLSLMQDMHPATCCPSVTHSGHADRPYFYIKEYVKMETNFNEYIKNLKGPLSEK